MGEHDGWFEGFAAHRAALPGITLQVRSEVSQPDVTIALSDHQAACPPARDQTRNSCMAHELP